jgi:uncharacterized membrane protein
MAELAARRAVRYALAVGVLLSCAFLTAGLWAARERWLETGLLILLFTPAVRVAILSGDYLRRKEWFFLAVSLCVLAMMFSGMGLGKQ